MALQRRTRAVTKAVWTVRLKSSSPTRMQFYRGKTAGCNYRQSQRKGPFLFISAKNKNKLEAKKLNSQLFYEQIFFLHILTIKAGTKNAVYLLVGEWLVGWQGRTLIVRTGRWLKKNDQKFCPPMREKAGGKKSKPKKQKKERQKGG